MPKDAWRMHYRGFLQGLVSVFFLAGCQASTSSSSLAANTHTPILPDWYVRATNSCIQVYQYDPKKLSACIAPYNLLLEDREAYEQQAYEQRQAKANQTTTTPTYVLDYPLGTSNLKAIMEDYRQRELHDAQMEFYKANTPGTVEYRLGRYRY